MSGTNIIAKIFTSLSPINEVPKKVTIKIWYQLPRHHLKTDISF